MDHVRLCEELPFQLLRSQQYDKLKDFCLEMRHFKQVWSRRRYDVYLYWRRIGEGNVPDDIGQLYCDAVAAQAGEWWKLTYAEVLEPGVRERTEEIAEVCGT